ncbi:hypothetical protein POTOM_048700 [Populus tomentosa]|uniref:Uncharacterized protein n=1 Tax=Populus tomentosa TaxID=118781 RepID=A0A8X7YDL3_POPTO|nr:hypothetical protein POTOM_048700 [Populus tomentosa]
MKRLKDVDAKNNRFTGYWESMEEKIGLDILDIFFGGAGTITTTIEWARSELLKSPSVIEKAQVELQQAFKGKSKVEEVGIENLDYLKAIIKETLRLHPVSSLLPTKAKERCEINGHETPVKAKVVINTQTP